MTQSHSAASGFRFTREIKRMWKYIVLILVMLMVVGLLYAHNQQYQGKSFTFYAPDQTHKIDVELEGHNNELSVKLDNVEIGTRTNFCTLLQNHQ
jgi:hypothetical protein